ncbi:efflux RND transporter permease subunit [Microbacterium sp. ASV49]|uniref:efflux RND transporter permease subunit n=1 Tax=Microbacterium candidum TaxID=3041922 RepID=UPI00336A806E
MSNLAVLSLKNRALIALVTIVAAVFGSLALLNLKQELIPSIEFPQLSIVSTYPGASPEVVNNDVSTPIETAIQGVPGLKTTSATSTTNASVVQAEFVYGTDLATAEQKVTLAIARIKDQLPTGVEPNVVTVSIDDFPVVQLAVTGYTDEVAVQQQLEATTIPALNDLPGVNAAQLVGARGQRVTITPDTAKLAAAGYTQQAIRDALKQNGVLFPGGSITENDQTLTVQTGDKLVSIDQINKLPLVPSTPAQAQAGAKTIGDVASVGQEQDPVTSISRVNGEPAISIAITKLPSANTVDVSKAVNNALPDIEKKTPGVHYTVVFDQAPYIQQSIDSLAQEGLLGLLFAVIIIFIFLWSVRSTLVAAISIPTSVLITFIGIQAFGYSLNILTLGALTIAIGRVVDDSIVVIENIRRHYIGGADKLTAIKRAVREVATAVSASTITTVAVFLPIAFVGDVTGELFRPFALTVTIAMLASLLVALTIVPVLAYWFLKPGKPLLDPAGAEIDPESPEAPPSRLQKAYLPIIRWTLRHSWITVSLALVVLIVTIMVAPLMKTNFLGDSGQNTFTMTQTLAPGASLEAKDAASKQVEHALKGVDGIQTVQTSIGSTGSALRDAFSGSAGGVTYSITTDPNADQTQVKADVQKAVDGLPEDAGTLTVSSGGGGFGSSDITIDVTAPDDKTLQTATDSVVSAVKGQPGIGQVSSNLSASLPYIAVRVDLAKAAGLGLSEVAVGSLVANEMQPQQIGTVEIDSTNLTVYLSASNSPTTVDALKAMDVPSLGGPVRLDSIATVEQSVGPVSITTDRGKRTATVTVTPSTDNLSEASTSVNSALKTVDLPASATATLGGVLSQQTDAFTQLGLAMLAAILIVYIVMVATFRSLRQPLLLLVSVPFAATGAILLQIITGVPLGVASLIGVLMLIGIVVTNAIVLVDLVNQYRVRGLTAHDAVVAGGSRRLRPILMTALATIFALTPMALGVTGHGGFISQPLAIVVIGGLISSTILTLLVLPTLYNLVEGAKERRAARRAARAAEAEHAVEAEPELVAVGAGGAEAGDAEAAAGAAGVAAAAYPTRRSRREAAAGATDAAAGATDAAQDAAPEATGEGAAAGAVTAAAVAGGAVAASEGAEEAEPEESGEEAESEESADGTEKAAAAESASSGDEESAEEKPADEQDAAPGSEEAEPASSESERVDEVEPPDQAETIVGDSAEPAASAESGEGAEAAEQAVETEEAVEAVEAADSAGAVESTESIESTESAEPSESEEGETPEDDASKPDVKNDGDESHRD